MEAAVKVLSAPGSGQDRAIAVPTSGGYLVAVADSAGSDGLFKYAHAERICALAMQGSVATAADALANAVRLPSGGLPDDVAVALVC